MRRLLTAAPFLLSLTGVCGCAGWSGWQANKGSQAVDFDLGAVGSGQSAITPSNAPGYMNGMPQDMRSGH
jgi:hypothetical protein